MYNRFTNCWNRLHQVKNIINNKYKLDSEGTKIFFDVFNPLNFKKLTEIEGKSPTKKLPRVSRNIQGWNEYLC